VRFLFIFFLGKVYGFEIAGQYGLIQAIISFSIYVMGLNFSTFSIREFALLDKNNNKIFFASQSIFFISIYFVIFLVAMPVAFLIGYDIKVSIGVFCLAVLNHMSLELVRILNSVGQFLTAAALLFLKSVGWVLVLVGLHFYQIISLDFRTLVMAWMVGEFIVVILCISAALKVIEPDWLKLDWEWIIKGIRSSAYLLVGALAMKGLFTIDRFFVGQIMEPEFLGIYIIFLAVANAMTIVTESAYVPLATPGLTRLFKLMRYDDFIRAGVRFFRSVLVSSTLLAVLAVVFFDSMGGFFKSDLFIAYRSIFYLIIVTILIHNFGISAQIILYAMREDSLNVSISVACLIVFMLAITIGYSFSESLEFCVPISLFIAAVAGFVLRSYSIFYCWKKLVVKPTV